jgi:broad specificity phosphatase PhoE
VTTRVRLISHGATAATRGTSFPLDEPLEPAAAAAARELAATLRVAPRASLLTGPEVRCRETAHLLGLAAGPDPALSDWDLGGWAGATLDDVIERDPLGAQAWVLDPAAAPHGGESLEALLARVTGWLDAREPESRTLAIAHPSTLRALAVHALGAPAAAFWRVDVPPLGRLDLNGRAGAWTVRLPDR